MRGVSSFHPGTARVLVFVLLLTVLPVRSTDTVALAQSQADQAAQFAYDLSVLESQGNFDQLYNTMHPDAQAMVPRAAVVGWYENEFAPLQPQPITEITAVRTVLWAWPVTGIRYANTFEVDFVQPFGTGANTSYVNETVRLVPAADGFGWFFGRSREFVDEQIARYGGSPDAPVASAGIGSCEGDAAWWAETYPRIVSADYSRYTVDYLLSGGSVPEEMLRQYERTFSGLYNEQIASRPPPAAMPLHEQLLEILSSYENASSLFASIAGGMNPMAEQGALSAAINYLDAGATQYLTFGTTVETFERTCQPLVVFVPGMGEDIPMPVMPGEVGPGIRPVECRLFDTQQQAQRFYDAAGPDDPHQLDKDGDGLACEPGE